MKLYFCWNQCCVLQLVLIGKLRTSARHATSAAAWHIHSLAHQDVYTLCLLHASKRACKPGVKCVVSHVWPKEARGLQRRLSATGRALEGIMCYWNYLLIWRQTKIAAGAVDLTSLRVGTGVGLNLTACLGAHQAYASATDPPVCTYSSSNDQHASSATVSTVCIAWHIIWQL